MTKEFSLLKQQDLFEARTHGYKTYRIPGLAVTRAGTVLATTEARPGGGGDYDFNDVLLRRSTDGGGRFAPFVKVVDHADYGAGPVSNFVMIPDLDDGRVHAVFCHDYARVFHMVSADDGPTFSAPGPLRPRLAGTGVNPCEIGNSGFTAAARRRRGHGAACEQPVERLPATASLPSSPQPPSRNR